MTTDTYPPIANTTPSFAYYAGLAQAQVILATGCTCDAAEVAVRDAGERWLGAQPTAAICRDVILDAVKAVRDA